MAKVKNLKLHSFKEPVSMNKSLKKSMRSLKSGKALVMMVSDITFYFTGLNLALQKFNQDTSSSTLNGTE